MLSLKHCTEYPMKCVIYRIPNEMRHVQNTKWNASKNFVCYILYKFGVVWCLYKAVVGFTRRITMNGSFFGRLVEDQRKLKKKWKNTKHKYLGVNRQNIKEKFRLFHAFISRPKCPKPKNIDTPKEKAMLCLFSFGITIFGGMTIIRGNMVIKIWLFY